MEQSGTWSFETAARTLWQEARSEPADGRKAVAHVIWNRLRAGRWGPTLAAVCMHPEHNSDLFEFSGWDARDSNRAATVLLPDDDPVLSTLRDVLIAAETEIDPTGNALAYYNPKIVPQPAWAKVLQFAGQFGSQRFYRDNLATGARA